MSNSHPKPHWILRLTPERHRTRVTRVGTVFGAICSMIWTLAAFVGIFLSPLAYSLWRPEAPIARLVLGLRRASGESAFIPVYSLVMIAIIGVVYSGHTFLEYVSQKAKNA